MNTEIVNREQQAKQAYQSIRNSLIKAQNSVYSAVNSAMVTAYWEAGGRYTMPAGKASAPPMDSIFCNICLNGLPRNLDEDIPFEICGICGSFIWPFQFGTHCVPN